MTLYLKTSFEDKPSVLHISKMNFVYKNDALINKKEYPKYKNLEKFGILNIKIHPIESKRWWDSLSDSTKDENYILVWDGGWISIPGEFVNEATVE